MGFFDWLLVFWFFLVSFIVIILVRERMKELGKI